MKKRIVYVLQGYREGIGQIYIKRFKSYKKACETSKRLSKVNVIVLTKYLWIPSKSKPIQRIVIFQKRIK